MTSTTTAQNNGCPRTRSLGLTQGTRARSLWHASARPARATTLVRGGDGSKLAKWVRPVLGELLLLDRSPEGLAAAGWGDSNLARLLKAYLVAVTLAIWPAIPLLLW
jgi:hypothetical protein